MKPTTIPAICVALVLSACTTFPSSKAQLFNSSPQKASYCYQGDTGEVTQRVRAYLFSCYRPFRTVTAAPAGAGMVTIPIGVDWVTQEEKVESEVLFTVKSPYGYVFGATISTPGEQCQINLKVVAINSSWSDRFETLDKVARGEPAKCPY